MIISVICVIMIICIICIVETCFNFDLLDCRLSGAHSCLVPINYFTSQAFMQLQTKGVASRFMRAADWRHLLLLLPFILDNLLKDEVDEYNRTKGSGEPALVDPSGELITVANTFLSWYKLYRRTTPPKVTQDVNTLLTLGNRCC